MKMYLLVDHSLKMRRGKTCAQVGHATSWFERKTMKEQKTRSQSKYLEWLRTGETKIVLKCDSSHLEKAIEEFPESIDVKDYGRTELEPGTRTVVALPLMNDNEVPQWIKDLPLL